MYATNHTELQLPPLKRSLLLIAGGMIVVFLVFAPVLVHGISIKIFLSWGIWIALFGTVLPPVLFAKGMPLTGLGLGAIILSPEIPVSVIFAHYVLGESIGSIEWSGIFLVLVSVMVINRQQVSKTKT